MVDKKPKFALLTELSEEDVLAAAEAHKLEVEAVTKTITACDVCSQPLFYVTNAAWRDVFATDPETYRPKLMPLAAHNICPAIRALKLQVAFHDDRIQRQEALCSALYERLGPSSGKRAAIRESLSTGLLRASDFMGRAARKVR